MKICMLFIPRFYARQHLYYIFRRCLTAVQPLQLYMAHTVTSQRQTRASLRGGEGKDRGGREGGGKGRGGREGEGGEGKGGEEALLVMWSTKLSALNPPWPRQFRPSVCPSHACIVSKRLNVSSKFFHHLIGPSF